MTTWTKGMLALILTGTSFLSGCTAEANDLPILDSVDSPRVVNASEEAYEVPVTILFHDNDYEAITHVRFRAAPHLDVTVDVPTPNPNRQSAEVVLTIPPEIGRAIRPGVSLEVSVLDGRGAESRPLFRTITLD